MLVVFFYGSAYLLIIQHLSNSKGYGNHVIMEKRDKFLLIKFL